MFGKNKNKKKKCRGFFDHEFEEVERFYGELKEATHNGNITVECVSGRTTIYKKCKHCGMSCEDQIVGKSLNK